MDKFQERAVRAHRERHEAKIREAASEIRDYAGYILRDLEKGRVPGDHADRVFSYAQTLVTRLAMLEAMSDVTGIMETSDEPAEPRQQRLPREGIQIGNHNVQSNMFG